MRSLTTPKNWQPNSGRYYPHFSESLSAIIALGLMFGAGFVEAHSGCCSTHGGVEASGCACNDGTSLSAECAPYYSCGVSIYIFSQTISFGSAPTVVAGGTGNISATATSGLPVDLSSLTSNICTIAGDTVTGIKAGTCIIAANQTGNANYNAAGQVTLSITIGTRSDDCIFNWAEHTYPQYFSPAGATSANYEQYYYRYYLGTGNYLATSSVDHHVWLLGPVSGNSLLDVGPSSDYLAVSGCSLP